MEFRASPGGPSTTDEVDRITINDLTTLVSDRGPAPMNIAAVLVVEGGAHLETRVVLSALEAGTVAVPRLRQRLRSAPRACGRPYWADDPRFDVSRHLTFATAEDDEALLRCAADQVCHRLPRDRPLWAATWVTGLGADRAALVVVAHHVLADGIGGLTVLGALTDPAGARPSHPPRVGPPTTEPTPVELAADAWRSRVRGVRSLPQRARLARAGIRTLRSAGGAADPRPLRRSGVRRPVLCPSTTLNRPSGPCRRLSTVELPLAEVADAGHRLGVTVNDLVLCAVAHAVATTLHARGESPESIVMSVPYSGRSASGEGRLGNETGVVPFRVPLDVDDAARLELVARMSREARARPRAATALPLGVAFRALAKVGLLQWFVDHQRLVNTFVTNVRGPSEPWRFCGCVVSRVVPVAVTPGNVAVTFDVLSYAGRLGVTVVADPAVVPNHGQLARHLQDALTELVNCSG